jgi:hypothetical protein
MTNTFRLSGLQMHMAFATGDFIINGCQGLAQPAFRL